MIRKVVIVMDSFKGSVSARQAVKCCADGVRDIVPDCKIVELPIADGGEGFAEVATSSDKYSSVFVTVEGPLGNKVTARYYYNADDKSAVMEMAQACGLTLIPPTERNPLKASSFGLGEMIMDALHRGARNIILGIGGSATNDAGMGMLCALGFRFIDTNGNILRGCGENLSTVSKIDVSLVPEIVSQASFLVACDVDNTFYGDKGATLVYGSQKGADSKMLNTLEKGMKHFSHIITEAGYPDFISLKGAGAAGGVGGTLYSLLNAQLKPGIDVTLSMLDFDKIVKGADLVITGEGSLDYQTCHGKTPVGVLRHAQKFNVPVIAIGGQVCDTEILSNIGFTAVLSIINKPMSLSKCTDIKTTKYNIRYTTSQIIKLITQFKNN